LTKLGRKTILQFGTLVGIISLVMIGIGFIVQGSGANTNTFASVLIISGLIIFMADFGLSLGPVVWLYIPEILEPNYIAFSTLANWTTASLITILFPILK
jgi:SP family arabinose:H+ symporter-like MFS transporter